MKRFLHVGCGPQRKPYVGPGFLGDDWQEVRLDIDPKVQPDIVGSMTSMPAVADGSMDAIYSSHNIEHLFPHDVPTALAEFLRVLKDDGFLLVGCPDLQTVCAMVAEDHLTATAYESSMGPITPLDILYGHRASMAAGNLYMAHRGGFTLKSLMQALQAAGFKSVAGRRRPGRLDLWAVATKGPWDEASLKALSEQQLP